MVLATFIEPSLEFSVSVFLSLLVTDPQSYLHRQYKYNQLITCL